VLRDLICTVIHGSNRVKTLPGQPGLLSYCTRTHGAATGAACRNTPIEAPSAPPTLAPVATRLRHLLSMSTPPQARTHWIVKRQKRHRFLTPQMKLNHECQSTDVALCQTKPFAERPILDAWRTFGICIASHGS